MLRPPAVLDLIEVDEENLAFIVMEQVSPRSTIFRGRPVERLSVELTIDRRRSTMLLGPISQCPSPVHRGTSTGCTDSPLFLTGQSSSTAYLCMDTALHI